ncbi:hypothetical protein [Amycolatopsis sp. H20-H5]|uniref:hypothetical protein n=1 Tax=Amycolatopsis sp. H20-H5 TaxID=3046309 RepID=UPI002DB8683F|nr:hypothetical protein [Amycolatopsis sp. H20-H5]MEC3979527.1 hypothetical protein [Amycolatopsis sp. H20-H5]
MDVRRSNEAIEYKNSGACLAYEYELPSDSVNAAVIELAGRYPDEGWALNTACTSLVHIVKGNGTISTAQTKEDLSTDDQVLLMPNEKYFFDGNMKLLYIASPAWTTEQAEHVK